MQRFTLPALTPDISYGLGSDFLGGLMLLLMCRLHPARRTQRPLRRGSVSFSPSPDGPLKIFDDATARPVVPNVSALRFPSVGRGPRQRCYVRIRNTLERTCSCLPWTLTESLKQDVQGAGGCSIHYDPGTTSFMAITATPLIAPGFRSAISILLEPWRRIQASTRHSSLTLGRPDHFI